MIIPESIKRKAEEEIKLLAENIAHKTMMLEELKAEIARNEEELKGAYAVLDLFEEKPPAPISEEPKKRRGRKKKAECEEMATPDVLRNEEQVRQREKYLRRKREKQAAEEAEREKRKPAESIQDVNEKARAAGMSYGQYVASQMIEQQSAEMAERREALRQRKAAEHEHEGLFEQN